MDKDFGFMNFFCRMDISSYASALSLYETTPFSIKSGISTASHGDNCQ